jgi:alpha-soluble NSF attachment protein
MSTERDAKEYLAQAEKLRTYTSWFGGNKQEEAAEYFNKAGNTFKLLKMCISFLAVIQGINM